MKKTLVFMSIATALFSGEANRATLTDIKEATVLLIKETKENKQAIEALKTRMNMHEKKTREVSLEEIKIKENLYLKPSKYDSQIADFLNRYENQPMESQQYRPAIVRPEQPILQPTEPQPIVQPIQPMPNDAFTDFFYPKTQPTNSNEPTDPNESINVLTKEKK